jgi:hypothetical protein
MSLRELVKRFPGIRSLAADRDRLRAELNAWKRWQSVPPGHYYSPIPDHDELRAAESNAPERTIAEPIGFIRPTETSSVGAKKVVFFGAGAKSFSPPKRARWGGTYSLSYSHIR